MARPKTYEEERVPTAVRLPKKLHNRLAKEADRRLVSRNLLIVRALERVLPEFEKEDWWDGRERHH